jgi:hypothetical protein
LAPEAGDPDFTPFVGRLPAPSSLHCNVNSGRPMPCTLRRDLDGVLTVRIGGKEPLLLNIYPDSADLFAIVGRKNVPIMARLVPHPGAMPCLWAEKRGQSIDQICVGVDVAGP